MYSDWRWIRYISMRAIRIEWDLATLLRKEAGSRGVVTKSYSGRRYIGTVVEPHAYRYQRKRSRSGIRENY